MDQNLFSSAAATLFREAFEGMPPGETHTWFVEKNEGIFDALSSVSAELASGRPSPNSASIAAHAYHILFALQHSNAYLGRPKPDGTWESSWVRQSVDDAQWISLRQSIRDEYSFFLDWLESNHEWTSEETITGAISQIAHMAFHLGAIRQLMRL